MPDIYGITYGILMDQHEDKILVLKIWNFLLPEAH